MGQRTTTVCDGRDCKAEYENPVTLGGPSMRQLPRGWSSMHFIDEKTGFPCSYDLCSSCVKKIIELLGLPTGEQLFRQTAGSLRIPGLSLPSLPSLNDSPPEPPKKCDTCGEPYVGASCYFCPPSSPLSEQQGDPAP